MANEIESTAIANGDSTAPRLVSIVVTTDDPTKNGIVVCNADGSAV